MNRCATQNQNIIKIDSVESRELIAAPAPEPVGSTKQADNRGSSTRNRALNQASVGNLAAMQSGHKIVVAVEECQENPSSMPNHETLLGEFQVLARSADRAQSLMQQMSDRLHAAMARYNWVGFYLMDVPTLKTLVLGPYAGSFNPTLRIPLDKGLCGAAATSGKTVTVNNVAADPRYLGSDLVKSNIVVPIFAKKRVMAELCIESYFANAFSPPEQAFIEACAALVGRAMEKETRSTAEKG